MTLSINLIILIDYRAARTGFSPFIPLQQSDQFFLSDNTNLQKDAQIRSPQLLAEALASI